MVLRALHLCSGYGGFELALRLAGINARTVAHVERDAYAAATLVARMEDQTLDQAPIWSDLTTFDGSAWHQRVDIVTAGFPCQPFSTAGQRRGVDDERWLWPHIARIVADLEPRFVFLENVPGLIRGGLPHVLADLATLGFDAEWGLLSAAEIGAPHKRERFWLLADRESLGCVDSTRFDSDRHIRPEPPTDRQNMGDASRTRRPEIPGSTPRDENPDGWRQDRTDVADGASETVADTPCIDGVHRRRLSVGQSGRGRQRTEVNSEELADACGPQCEGVGSGATGPEHAWPPRPDDEDGWERWIAAGGPEPAVRRSADGPPTGLADALHLGGNGLVPAVAAAAFHVLAERLREN